MTTNIISIFNYEKEKAYRIGLNDSYLDHFYQEFAKITK